MISADGWLDWAERVTAHPSKIKGTGNPAVGFIAHSAEGYEAYLRDNPPRTDGWGWHFSNLYDGTLLQHMPINAACWSSGHQTPNYNFVAMEHEGVAGQPLTEAQRATTAQVILEVATARGWQPTRIGPNRTLHEHREWSQTACPSGRIPWDDILASLKESDVAGPTTEDLRGRLVEAITNKYVPMLRGTNPIGEYVVELLDKDGSSADPPIFLAVLAPGQTR